MWNNSVDRDVLISHLALHGWEPVTFYWPGGPAMDAITNRERIFIAYKNNDSMQGIAYRPNRMFLRQHGWHPRPVLVKLANAVEQHYVGA